MDSSNVNALLRRLRGNNRRDAIKAARALAVHCNNVDSRADVIAAGGVPALVQCLNSSQSSNVLLEPAALALSVGSIASDFRAVIAASGGIPALMQLLHRSGISQAAIESAIYVLQNLSNGEPATKERIVAAGGIPALAEHLHKGSEAVQAPAAAALARLCANSPSRINATRETVSIPTLVQCLNSSGNGGLQANSALLLGFLGHNNPVTTDIIVSAGAIPTFVQLLHCGGEGGQTAATGALASLCVTSPSVANVVREAVSIPKLVQCLSISGIGQTYAATLLANLAKNNPVVKEHTVAAGGIPALAGLLHNGSEMVQAPAAAALAHLSSGSPSRSNAICEAIKASIPNLVQCLNSDGSEDLQANAAMLVANLAYSSPSITERIVVAGSIPALLHCLRSSSSNLQVNASVALVNLASGSAGDAAAIAAAGAIPALQQLHSSSTCDGVRSEAAAALTILAALGYGEAPGASSGAAAGIESGPAEGAECASGAEAVNAAGPAGSRLCAADGCGNTQGLQRCGGCKAVRYCSEVCCQAHWKAHKPECRRLSQAAKT